MRHRLGFEHYSLAAQDHAGIITMIVFAGFAVLYMKQPLKLDFLWASLCMVGAVYFMFRGGLPHHG